MVQVVRCNCDHIYKMQEILELTVEILKSYFTRVNHIHYFHGSKIDIEEKESSLIDQISKF